MGKANIDLIIGGVKGGNPKSDYNKGRVEVTIDETNKYTGFDVDAFEGHGDTYKRREKSQITIIDNGDKIFTGTMEELVNKLK